jgi:predicted RNA-binding protein YlqC (UPF0109 family)
MDDRALELVRFIAESLVTEKDEVKVRKIERDRTVVLELSVAPDDMGRVIGKQGRIAKAIRSVVRSATSDQRKRYTVDIVE